MLGGMSTEIPHFSPDQQAAMAASAELMNEVAGHLRDHLITYDPAQDTHPNLVSFDKFFAEIGAAETHQVLPVSSDGEMRLLLYRQFGGEPEAPKAFGHKWESFQEPEYASYRALDVTHAGLMDISSPGRTGKEHYTAYQIHQPDGPLDELGIIVGARLVAPPVTMTIQDGGELEKAAKVATRRLYELAANIEGPDAEAFEATANSALIQTEISGTPIEPDHNGYRILGERDVRELSDVVHFMIQHGTDIHEED
jgi:hypothetical protein